MQTANAFEELIAEKLPKLHHLLRKTYDTIGFPVSQTINTQAKANAVYFCMKPLEVFFPAVLYLCDSAPETRIARQYRGASI